MIWALIALAVIMLDQFTKWLVWANLAPTGSIAVINNFFYISYTENTGAAFSILRSGRFFFIPITIIISLVIVYYLYKNHKKSSLLNLSLSLILGGAIGNLVDRIRLGYVVDFFELRFGSYTYPIFNIADSAVVIGTCLLALYILFFYRDDRGGFSGQI